MFQPVNIDFTKLADRVLVVGNTPQAVQWVKQFLYYGCPVRLVADKLPEELQDIPNLEFDQSEELEKASRKFKENTVAIDTGDHELDLYLACYFSYNSMKILTSVPTLWSNLALSDIEKQKLDDFIKKLRRDPAKITSRLPRELEKKLQGEEIITDGPIRRIIRIGIPETASSKNMLENEIIELRKKLPHVKFEPVKIESIGKDRDWREYRSREQIPLNSPVNLAYEALMHDKADMFLLNGDSLPPDLPDSLKLIAGFNPRVSGEIIAIRPEKFESNYDGIGKVDFVFSDERVFGEFCDTLFIESESLDWLENHHRYLSQEDIDHLDEFVVNNKESILIMPFFKILEKSVLKYRDLEKNNLTVFSTVLAPETLHGTIVALVRNDNRGEEVCRTLKPIINRDEEIQVLFEHYFIELMEVNYAKNLDTYSGGGFVKNNNGEFGFIAYIQLSRIGIPHIVITDFHEKIEDTILEALKKI